MDAALPETEAEVGRRFESRRSLLQGACRRLAGSPLFRQRQRVHMQVVGPLRAFYCPIEKCGSTTWKNILNRIREELQPLTKQGPPLVNPDPSRLSGFRGFVFVRDPYSRLLSAYVDKFFSPNPMYWNRVGRYIVSTFRRGDRPSRRSLRCGHDVTFPEFVRYVLHSQRTGRHREPHFIPAHDHCGFCRYNYSYVGHLETLAQDLPFVLRALGSPVGYGQDFGADTIRANLRRLFMRAEDFTRRQCMSLGEGLRRLWKRWHARGLISRHRPFPFPDPPARGFSFRTVKAAALEAHRKSGGPRSASRRKQQRAALAEAFSAVPAHDRRDLRDLLLLDFQLFGFDSAPTEVFPVGAEKPSTNYSYFSVTD